MAGELQGKETNAIVTDGSCFRRQSKDMACHAWVPGSWNDRTIMDNSNMFNKIRGGI